VVDINVMIKLKKDVKRLGQEKDRAKGRVDQLLKTLEDEFDCSSLKEAQELLKKNERALKKLDGEYESRLDSFMEEWGDQLGEEE